MLTEEERKYLDDKYALRQKCGGNALLGSVMRYFRKSRSILDPGDAFSIFETNELVQIWLQTPACRFSQEGKCTVCNYWAGRKVPGLVERMKRTICIPEGTNTILINTCGSCLDPQELMIDEQNQLFKWLNKQPAEDIILETHMFTLSEDTVRRVRDLIPDKNLFFEIGQESINGDVQFYSLNKSLPERGVDTVINRIHRYGAKSIVNVILGAPFLNREEQIRDAVESIIGLLQKGTDYIMLFPVNIKPDTLVSYLYNAGIYSLIDGGMIARVMDELPEKYLSRVGIAWYGEHQETGVLPPDIPDVDRLEFNATIAAYNSSCCMEDRKRLVKALMDKEKKWKPGRKKENENRCFVERLDRGYQMLCEKILNNKGN